MKYIKIKPGNSILQTAGQFPAFVLTGFYKMRGYYFTKQR